MRNLSIFALAVSWFLVPSSPGVAGVCANAEQCFSPCPAENSCYSASDCGAGMSCVPYGSGLPCDPSECICVGGEWRCTSDCAGQCSLDTDGDEVPDLIDNCPWVANGVAEDDQADADSNGVGDACNDFEDADGDDWADSLDNCPAISNADQSDSDEDGIGDACDRVVPVLGPSGLVILALALAVGGVTGTRRLASSD